MKSDDQVERCKAYLESATIDLSGERRAKKDGPVVTISRAAGARGSSIAEALVRRLESERGLPKNRPWTLFNQNLIQYVIKENQLPDATAEFFPEDGRTEKVRSIIAEILGVHPGSYNTLARTAETIHRLAREGNVVIVGRGGNFITADIERVLRVRLVGDEMARARHVAARDQISVKTAVAENARLDRNRKRYIRRVFRKDVADVLNYDLVLKTDGFSNDDAADLIAMALLRKLARL